MKGLSCCSSGWACYNSVDWPGKAGEFTQDGSANQHRSPLGRHHALSTLGWGPATANEPSLQTKRRCALVVSFPGCSPIYATPLASRTSHCPHSPHTSPHSGACRPDTAQAPTLSQTCAVSHCLRVVPVHAKVLGVYWVHELALLDRNLSRQGHSKDNAKPEEYLYLGDREGENGEGEVAKKF